MIPLLIIGAGGHCRSCIDVIETTRLYQIRGVVQAAGADTSSVFDYPTLGSDEELKCLIGDTPAVFIAVGQMKTPDTRIRLFKLVKDYDANLPIIQSPTAYCSPRALLGEGTILMHGSMINANSALGANCIINSHALVEHDVIIGDHCHVSTGSRINGGVVIGDGVFIGSGCVIREGITIGNRAIIGAGQIVLKDVPAGTIKK